jgi:primosomal protein N' (replication factor Y)
MKKSDIIENILSTELYDKLYHCIEKDEQAILLLNRKGYSNQLICKECGAYLTCPNCSVSMVYYKSSEYAKCTYCNESLSYLKCSKCDSNSFINFGVGTEKAYELLNNLFKNKVLKVDMDDVTSQKRLDSLLDDFTDKKYNILIGTQIVAKGLNFEDVTLVGVLNIDHQFALPDFRASERAYQLLMQVAGRAGRFKKKGIVAIQTFNTEETIFSLVNKKINYFYDYELNRRNILNYPPYYRMIRIVLSYSKVEDLKSISSKIFNEIKNIDELEILGPSMAPIFKIKNRFRYNLLLKSKSVKVLNTTGRKIIQIFNKHKMGNMEIRIDVDPYSFM